MNGSGSGIRRAASSARPPVRPFERSEYSGTAPPFRVLIACDDDDLRVILSDSLVDAGFALGQVSSVEAALDYVTQKAFDLVLLEMDKPAMAAIAVCRRLRIAAPDLGIIMVRSGSGSESDILALDAGADDCIATPLRFREIVARLNAVLRRVREKPPSITAMLRAGDLELDPERRLLFRGRREIHLSPREFELLAFLMKHPDVAHTHIKLLRAVWGIASNQDTGSLRSYIKSLRQKIENDPPRPEYIITEPWVGYRFHIPRRLP
jgi:two-component system KDP operon response regulator KdpE